VQRRQRRQVRDVQGGQRRGQSQVVQVATGLELLALREQRLVQRDLAEPVG
jgi:hypothetical protein